MIILKLIVTWVLQFLSKKFQDAYESALREQRNKRVVLNEVKEILNEAKIRNEDIASQPESVTDSMSRLRRLAEAKRNSDGGAKWTSPFAGFDASRARRDSDGVAGESSTISSSESASGGGNRTGE